MATTRQQHLGCFPGDTNRDDKGVVLRDRRAWGQGCDVAEARMAGTCPRPVAAVGRWGLCFQTPFCASQSPTTRHAKSHCFQSYREALLPIGCWEILNSCLLVKFAGYNALPTTASSWLPSSVSGCGVGKSHTHNGPLGASVSRLQLALAAAPTSPQTIPPEKAS